MKNPILAGLSKATKLTKAGNLQQATALIQSLLQGHKNAPDVASDDSVEGRLVPFDPVGTKPLSPNAAPFSSYKAVGLGKDSVRMKGVGTALSETLRRIAAGGMQGTGALAQAPIRIPENAKFEWHTYSSQYGARDYKLYIPANRPAEPMPLIVMLHGCTQTPDDFAVGTGMNGLAEEFGCLVAYPAQPSGANVQKCWNWFRPEDQARGGGEPALIAGLVQEIARLNGVDPSRVYVAGLSAGGAAAAILANAYPDVFHGVGVHSGLPVGAASDVASAFSAMRSGADGQLLTSAVPTIVFHGTEDATVHPNNGRALARRARELLDGASRSETRGIAAGGTAYRTIRLSEPNGSSVLEYWELEGIGHAWSGGHPPGSYTDPAGPDASREMLKFFLDLPQ